MKRIRLKPHKDKGGYLAFPKNSKSYKEIGKIFKEAQKGVVTMRMKKINYKRLYRALREHYKRLNNKHKEVVKNYEALSKSYVRLEKKHAKGC